MDEWGCPWCGEKHITNKPDSQRSIVAFDIWLEAHVMDCEPWSDEQRLSS